MKKLIGNISNGEAFFVGFFFGFLFFNNQTLNESPKIKQLRIRLNKGMSNDAENIKADWINIGGYFNKAVSHEQQQKACS